MSSPRDSQRRFWKKSFSEEAQNIINMFKSSFNILIIGIYSLSSMYASGLAPITMKGKSVPHIVTSSAISWLLLALLPTNRHAEHKFLSCEKMEQVEKVKLMNVGIALFACSGVAFTLTKSLPLTLASYVLQSGAIIMKGLTEKKVRVRRGAIASMFIGGAFGSAMYLSNNEYDSVFIENNVINSCQVANLINLMNEFVSLCYNEDVPETDKKCLYTLFCGIVSFNAFAICTHVEGFNNEALNNSLLVIASFLVLIAIVILEINELKKANVNNDYQQLGGG
jgi:hypothetical protein